MILPLLIIAAFVMASSGKKPGKGGGKLPKLPKPRKPPRPSPADERMRGFLCGLVSEGIPQGGLLPLVLRELYPAVSWPAADEWSNADVTALPPEDRAVHDATKKKVDALLVDGAFLAECTSDASPYASGRVSRRGSKYEASWSYDPRVEGDRGGAMTFASIDGARAALLMGLWWFGGAASEQDQFVEAFTKPGTDRRLSIWTMPGGGYRIVRIRGDATDVFQVGTLDVARAEKGTL